MSIRVLIVDDQELVRIGFRLFLETQPGLAVVGEAGDGEEAIERVREVRPDVVLMDIRMPVMDGVEATAKLTSGAIQPAPRVLAPHGVRRRRVRLRCAASRRRGLPAEGRAA